MKVIDIIKSLFASLKSLSTRKKKPKPSIGLPEQKLKRGVPYKLRQDTPKSIQDLPEQESPFILVSDVNQTEFHRINIDEPKQATFTHPIACEIDGHRFDIVPQNYKSLLLTIVNYFISIKHPRIQELDKVSFVKDYPFFMDKTIRPHYYIRTSNGKFIFTENNPETIIFLLGKFLDYCGIDKGLIKIFASYSKQPDNPNLQAKSTQTEQSSNNTELSLNRQQDELNEQFGRIQLPESPEEHAPIDSQKANQLVESQDKVEKMPDFNGLKENAMGNNLSTANLREGQFIVDFKEPAKCINTRPIVCSIGKTKIELQRNSWIYLFKSIIEREIKKENPKLNSLNTINFFRNRPLFFDSIERPDLYQKLSNGKWIYSTYNSSAIVTQIAKFLLHCGYDLGKVKIIATDTEFTSKDKTPLSKPGSYSATPDWTDLVDTEEISNFRIFLSNFSLPEGVTGDQLIEVMASLPKKLNLPETVTKDIFLARDLASAQELLFEYCNTSNYHELNIQANKGLFTVGARAWIEFLKTSDANNGVIETHSDEEINELDPEGITETIEDAKPNNESLTPNDSEALGYEHDEPGEDAELDQESEPISEVALQSVDSSLCESSVETSQKATEDDDHVNDPFLEMTIAHTEIIEEPKIQDFIEDKPNVAQTISNDTNVPFNTPQRNKPSEEKKKPFIDYLTKKENMSYPNAVYTAIALENMPNKFGLPVPEYDFYECKTLADVKQIRDTYFWTENFTLINHRQNQIYTKAITRFFNFISSTAKLSQSDASKIQTNLVKTFGSTEKQLIHEIEKFIVRDNVIYIPSSDSTYRKLAAYAQQQNKTVNRLIQSFGFRRTYERPIQPGDPEESDMQEHDYSGNDLVDRAFAQYPLIGSMILVDEERSAILDEARELINKKLSERNKNFTARDKSILTLAIIQIAKDWDSSKQSKFWNYISRYLGYRDAESQSGWATVESLLKNALEDTCRDKKRIFIEDTGQRWFRGTVTLHALTPRDSWYAFFDFLFDFYRENLNWKATPNDPLIETMIQSLRQRFSDVKEEDYKITISSKSYSFREGIRKLIVARPKFSSKLSYELIAYIHALLNNSNSEPERYEEKLCCEWFEDKIGRIAEIRKNVRSFPDESGEVATDYSRIQAKFILKDNNKILLSLPEIRLEGEKSKPDLKLELYQGEKLLQIHENLPYYGNELGWTLKSKKLELTSIKGANDFGHLKVRLLSSDEIIYDSEEKLFRKAFIFKGQNEITDHHKLSVGEYTMITPQSRDIEINIENGEISPINGFQLQGWRANFFELNPNFFLSVGETISSFDREELGVGFHVLPPEESTHSPIIIKGEKEFVFAKRTSCIRLFLSDASQINHYVVHVNGQRIDLKKLEYDPKFKVIMLPFEDSSETCQLRVLDMNEEKILYHENFILVNRVSFKFDKEFYFSSSDFVNASLSVCLDDYSDKILITENDETLSIPYKDSEIKIQIPRIYLEVVEEPWNFRERPAWHITDIPRKSQFKISCPKEINASISLGSSENPFEKEICHIGEMIHMNPNSSISSEPITLILKKNHQVVNKYPLTSVFHKERFLNRPSFREDKGVLYWDRGGLFIGKENPKLTLRLGTRTDESLEFPLSTETVSIQLPKGIQEGPYWFEIELIRQNIFREEKETIAKGSVLIGDKNRLRFKDQRIVINEITVDPESQGAIKIHPCYVDEIEYLGEQHTSEGFCPVYRGVMYRYEKGKRIDFASEEQANRYVVNPVRMIYISDRSMSITHEQGDGLYFCKTYDYDTNTDYCITDIECDNSNKKRYSTPELYIYKTERI